MAGQCFYDVAVIGGGASGIFAAISARLNGAEKVALIEKNDRIGKKLLITGNGRCNLSNIDADISGYNANAEFAKRVISEFTVADTVSFFEKYGLFTVADEQGRIYPITNQASSVLDVLRLMCEQLSVDVMCGISVKNIVKKRGRFCIIYDDGEILSKAVIAACAGKAAPSTGSNGDMLKILEKAGHNVIKPQPSLCPLNTDRSIFKSLKGVRAKCKATLYKNNRPICSDTGEVQFNEDNISGIVIMQLSSKMREDKGVWQIGLDLMENIANERLADALYLRKRAMPQFACEHLLDGMVNKKLAILILRRAGIEKMTVPVSQLDAKTIRTICGSIHDLRFDIKSKAGFDKAQVTAGGLDVKQFGADLQSSIIEGLYACGEILDVDGICGGYNLQWAWSSGYAAGKNAAVKSKR